MIVVLNRHAGEGRAIDKWRGIEPDLRRVLGNFSLLEPSDMAAVSVGVKDAVERGETRFVAAGGDGTVNAVVNAVLTGAPAPALSQIAIGAVGLGSSNDFQKPFRRVIEGVGCRIDFERAQAADVGRIVWLGTDWKSRSAYWVLNASVGTTAAGNWSFNHPDRFLRFLKRTSPGSAIAYSALRCLAHQPDDVFMTLDDGLRASARIRNLGIVKNPHFTGSLCYDSPDEPASGRFFVHCLADVSLPRMILTMASLSRGHFSGLKGTWSRPARELSVESLAEPFPVEFDGEVVRARRARFTLLHGKLRFCP